MTESSTIHRLMAEQRKRLLATVLGAIEQETDPKVRRDRIVAGINNFYDFCRDVIKVSDEGVVRNDEALELIASVRRIEGALTRG